MYNMVGILPYLQNVAGAANGMGASSGSMNPSPLSSVMMPNGGAMSANIGAHPMQPISPQNGQNNQDAGNTINSLSSLMKTLLGNGGNIGSGGNSAGLLGGLLNNIYGLQGTGTQGNPWMSLPPSLLNGGGNLGGALPMGFNGPSQYLVQ